MGISINLYRVSPAEKIEDLKTIDLELEKSSEAKVNLYKMTEDLALIFLDEPDPFRDLKTIPYKMLFGNGNQQVPGHPEIGGFIPSSEVRAITEWIGQNKMTDFEGFSKKYDSLSDEVRAQLEEIGSPGKEELYQGYAAPLINFYFAALKENNSVVICGE